MNFHVRPVFSPDTSLLCPSVVVEASIRSWRLARRLHRACGEDRAVSLVKPLSDSRLSSYLVRVSFLTSRGSASGMTPVQQSVLLPP